MGWVIHQAEPRAAGGDPITLHVLTAQLLCTNNKVALLKSPIFPHCLREERRAGGDGWMAALLAGRDAAVPRGKRDTVWGHTATPPRRHTWARQSSSDRPGCLEAREPDDRGASRGFLGIAHCEEEQDVAGERGHMEVGQHFFSSWRQEQYRAVQVQE